MGLRVGDLNAVRQDLQQINTQIADLHMDEQQSQEFVRIQEEIRRQMSLDNGSFAPKNEQEFLALTKVKLEQDIEEITKLIQKENGEVAVTQSARQEQVTTPPGEPVITDRAAGLLRREPPAFPRLSKRQWKARIKQEEKKRVAYQKDAAKDMEMSRRVSEIGVMPDKRLELYQIYDDYWKLYRDNGWKRKGEDIDQISDPVQREKMQKEQMQEFFRELNNAGCFSEERMHLGDFPLNVAEFSREDIQFTLAHPNEEGVKRILKPLLEFDPKQMMKKFQVHKLKTPEKRAKMIQEFHIEYHKVNSAIQWADKFGKDKMSPEFAREYSFLVSQFNMFSAYIYNPSVPSGTATGEFFDSLKEDYTLLRERLNHEEEFKEISKSVAREPVVEVNVQNAVQMAEQLKAGKLVTDDGRARLLGLEPADLTLQYAKEDLSFYKKMKDIGRQLTRTPALLNLFSPQEAAQLRTLAKEYNAFFQALNDRVESPDTLSCMTRKELQRGFSEPAGYLKKQFSQMD